MTVPVAYNRQTFDGDGSTTIFAVSFQIEEEADVLVNLEDADGNLTEQSLSGGDYTITATNNDFSSGFNLTMATAPASGTILSAERILSLLQASDYVEGDPAPAARYEADLDLLTMADQQINDKAVRSLKAPATEGSGIDMTIPSLAQRKGKYLYFDATTGDPEGVTNIASDTVTITGFAETFLDDANAAAICDTIGALDVNNDDLDDVPEGTTYKRLLADSQDGSGRINQIEGDTEFRSAQIRFYSPTLIVAHGAHMTSTLQRIVISGDGNGYLDCQLPHDAIVTEFYSYVNIAAGTVTISIIRCIKTGTTAATLAQNAHSAAGGLTDTEISNATIDNDTYYYYIQIARASHSGNTYVDGMGIKYTILEPKP